MHSNMMPVASRHQHRGQGNLPSAAAMVRGETAWVDGGPHGSLTACSRKRNCSLCENAARARSSQGGIPRPNSWMRFSARYRTLTTINVGSASMLLPGPCPVKNAHVQGSNLCIPRKNPEASVLVAASWLSSEEVRWPKTRRQAACSAHTQTHPSPWNPLRP